MVLNKDEHLHSLYSNVTTGPKLKSDGAAKGRFNFSTFINLTDRLSDRENKSDGSRQECEKAWKVGSM